MARRGGFPNGFKAHLNVPAKFPKATMTRAQNRTLYTLWLYGCSDEALASANPESLARSYGLQIGDVTADIARQVRLRKLSA